MKSIISLILSAILLALSLVMTDKSTSEISIQDSTVSSEITEETESETGLNPASTTAYNEKSTSVQPGQKLKVIYEDFVYSETETESTDKNLGTFKITVYTPSSDDGKWGYMTASGETAKHLQTCAVDPNIIPLGSTVYVNGLTLRANDTGSAVKGNVIDIFYDGTEEDAIEWISQFGDYHIVSVEIEL